MKAHLLRERERKKREGQCLLGVWLYDKCSRKSSTENLGEFSRAWKEGGNSMGRATLHYQGTLQKPVRLTGDHRLIAVK